MTKSDFIHVRVSPDVKHFYIDSAAGARRTLSDFISLVLECVMASDGVGLETLFQPIGKPEDDGESSD